MATETLPPLLTMDHEPVRNCPRHEWVMQDRTPEGVADFSGWHWVAVCEHCNGARCGHLNDTNPCMLARHHRVDHEYRNGGRAKVGA